MNKNILFSIDLLFEFLQYINSFEDLCSLALVKKNWYETICSFIESNQFLVTLETLIIEDIQQQAKNLIYENKTKKKLLEIILNKKHSDIKLLTVKSIEFNNSLVEYIIQNFNEIENLKLIVEYKVSNYMVNKLCSNIKTLRRISIIPNRKYGDKLVKNGNYLFQPSEREIIVRRPKSSHLDNILTKEGTIKKYSSFYTQDISNKLHNL